MASNCSQYSCEPVRSVLSEFRIRGGDRHGASARLQPFRAVRPRSPRTEAMMKYFWATMLLGLTIVVPCQASGIFHPCSRCGCTQLKKVCRLVPDVKKVTQSSYTVQENEVCLLGKSSTETTVVPDPCALHGRRSETTQTPQCGRIVCMKKLKKTTTTVEKPTAKCVMETVCCQCGCVCDTGNCMP